MSFRLGVDVGGAFTDVLLVEERTGTTWRAKTASTPSDQAIGVLNGIGRVCADAGISLADVAEVLHGTTVATNAILEGKGATVGLVTTHGFRQVLQIARSYVPGGLAGWIIWPKPEPLAALENTVEVRERLASDGTVIRALDEDDVRAQLTKLVGVEALAVSLINSFADPAHERRIAEIAAEVLPGVPVSLSSDVLPELREYERTITTVANGYGGLRLVSVQQGFDPRDFALVAFGGAGPLHANALGKLTGAWPVIVPPSPGVLCALGDATTSRRSESARTVLRRFADLSGDELARILGELAAEAGGR